MYVCIATIEYGLKYSLSFSFLFLINKILLVKGILIMVNSHI